MEVYYKEVSVRTVVLEQTRAMIPIRHIREPLTDPCIYGNLICDKRWHCIYTNGERMGYFPKMTLRCRGICRRKNLHGQKTRKIHNFSAIRQ